MTRTRCFKGKGETPLEAYWSAGDQAAKWIEEMAKTGPLTYRAITFWSASIAFATVRFL